MTSQRVEVRPLDSADLDALLGVYADIGLLDSPSSRSVVEQTWARIVTNDLLYYLGVFVDGELVSTCHAVIVPNLTRGARPYAVIENVGTLSSHRRRGFASLAMHTIIDHCWEAGCYKIMLASAIERSGAHAFYEGLGFDGSAKRSFVLKRSEAKSRGTLPNEGGRI